MAKDLSHHHVTSHLCIAFIALRSLPSLTLDWWGMHGVEYEKEEQLFGDGVRVQSRVTVNGVQEALWLMSHVTGFGHPHCLTCHERYADARGLGYHEARKLLEHAEGRRKILTAYTAAE